jgi:hypothetical protein
MLTIDTFLQYALQSDILFDSFGICLGYSSLAQRTYKSNSVLTAGSWYRIGIKDPGVHKVDVAFLSGLGFNVTYLSSTSIRLFGNGGEMLSENNTTIPKDDLQENPIMIVDGGDGIFNDGDYFLFYENGPDQWIKDSANKKFIHQKNIYADSVYYFLLSEVREKE